MGLNRIVMHSNVAQNQKQNKAMSPPAWPKHQISASGYDVGSRAGLVPVPSVSIAAR
jgi:hypothetical protein